MDSPLSTLRFVIFGITFSIYSVIAEAPSPPTSASRPPPPPRLRPPPHLSPAPPPRLRPPPHLSHAPPPRLPPPPHLSPAPPPRLPPPPHLSPAPPPQPSYAPAAWRPPVSPHNLTHAKPVNPNWTHHRSPPRPTSHRMNGGKKIGLLFAGVAGIMQIGVVGFLVFKRRQLLRTKDAFEVGA